ncbi:MAG: hypothetical protein ACI94Y_002992 [Maribacter sp.]|jgi:hypothetical protein
MKKRGDLDVFCSRDRTSRAIPVKKMYLPIVKTKIWNKKTD